MRQSLPQAQESLLFVLKQEPILLQLDKGLQVEAGDWKQLDQVKMGTVQG